MANTWKMLGTWQSRVSDFYKGKANLYLFAGLSEPGLITFRTHEITKDYGTLRVLILEALEGSFNENEKRISKGVPFDMYMFNTPEIIAEIEQAGPRSIQDVQFYNTTLLCEESYPNLEELAQKVEISSEIIGNIAAVYFKEDGLPQEFWPENLSGIDMELAKIEFYTRNIFALGKKNKEVIKSLEYATERYLGWCLMQEIAQNKLEVINSILSIPDRFLSSKGELDSMNAWQKFYDRVNNSSHQSTRRLSEILADKQKQFQLVGMKMPYDIEVEKQKLIGHFINPENLSS